MQTSKAILNLTPPKAWVIASAVSLFLHLATGGGLTSIVPPLEPKVTGAVKIKVAAPPAPPSEQERPKEPRPKTPPRKDKIAPNTSTPTNASESAKPVQGLTSQSLGLEGTMAAPRGNTMMTGDTGQRLSDVQDLKGDLSEPARLIATSLVIPPYTDEALDAALEGSFIVDVFVNLDGSVREAELRKKIGFGMDQRVIAAVKSAKFVPRKNKIGVPEAGWAELKFTLVIP
jgi:TonB family protein